MTLSRASALLCAAATCLLAACDGGPCASEFSGHWIGTTLTDSLDVDPGCSFAYNGVNGCKSTGTYAAPIADQGAVRVSITASTGGLCLPPGEYVCDYVASSSRLTFGCGAVTASYAR